MRPDGRGEAAGEAGCDRDREGEEEHPPVDPDRPGPRHGLGVHGEEGAGDSGGGCCSEDLIEKRNEDG